MFVKYVVGVFAITLILTSAVLASGIPDVTQCTVTCAYEGPETPVILNRPDGWGSPFTAARIIPGITVDATITLILRDGTGAPIENFPFEDLWLAPNCDEMLICPNGATADASTDVNGMTTWVNPLKAGGYCQDLTYVVVNGDVVNPGLNISHNSPDITGDGYVNLADVGRFAVDFYGAYTFRSDLFYDGIVDLSDLPKLAGALGAACP